jgi:hypothetical protein
LAIVLPTLQGMGRISRGTLADRGAAALEFALVVPVLAVLVFGMIDYGLYFTDSLGARDGARVAARQGSVANFKGVCPAGYSGSGDSDLSTLACTAVDQTGAIGGDVYARVKTTPAGWKVGKDVVVCVAVVESGLTGLTPMPNDSTVRTRLQMRIEQPSSPPDGPSAIAEAKSTTAVEPTKLWDSWCD